MSNGLVGKSVYAFGDSIVYGHVYPHSFVDVVAEHEGMALTKFARNGATMAPTRMLPEDRYSRRSSK
ncbi:hypothetical protein [Streptomyces sp. ME19-01-6]|uniref:hypothetical protein n=1 Tax=Streptomyces sp. ME19-01-6 TaxID=3028686 RepID=UPI0029AD3E91|nr:hypothetical protein [Streptomyces sp. ME19-01-6]MDX3228935.1 hypothetical protein [Streptomyces sp. ME19-01-6]